MRWWRSGAHPHSRHPPPQRPQHHNQRAPTWLYSSSSYLRVFFFVFSCISFRPPWNCSSKVNSYTPSYMLRSWFPPSGPVGGTSLHDAVFQKNSTLSERRITLDQISTELRSTGYWTETDLSPESFYRRKLPMLRHMLRWPHHEAARSYRCFLRLPLDGSLRFKFSLDAAWRPSIWSKSLECLCTCQEWHDPATLRTIFLSHGVESTSLQHTLLLNISLHYYEAVFINNNKYWFINKDLQH